MPGRIKLFVHSGHNNALHLFRALYAQHGMGSPNRNSQALNLLFVDLVARSAAGFNETDYIDPGLQGMVSA